LSVVLGDESPPDDPGNPTLNFRGEKRSNATHQQSVNKRWQRGHRRDAQGALGQFGPCGADGDEVYT
jgi:hypothetical protein